MYNKNKRRLPLIGILLFLFFSIGFGQVTSLTLDEAISIALKNSREVQMARLEVDRADAAVSEAFGYALPSLDVSANFSHFLQKPKMAFPDFQAMLTNATYGVLFQEGVIPYDASKFMPMQTKLQTFAQENSYQAQAQVTQILFNSAVLRGIGASQIYLNLSKENLKSTVSKTTLDVKKAYYGVLLARDILKITKSRFANANEHLKTIRSMRAQGLISEYDQMQAEVQVENIRPVILQLENVLQNATNGLKILLNLDQNKSIQVMGEMTYAEEPLPTEAELVHQALRSNLTLSTLKIKRQLDDELAAIDRGGYWPTLAAFGNYTYAGSGEGWDFQNYSSSMVGLSFSINLFQGGRTAQKVEQDEIAGRKTDQQISLLSDATQNGIKSRLNDLKRVKSIITLMQRNIDLAQRAYEIARDRYKQGLGSELELKDADVALGQAKTNYTNAVHDYLIAKAELDNLVGRIDAKYLKFVEESLNK